MANRALDLVGNSFNMTGISKNARSMLPDCSLRSVFSLVFTSLNYPASGFSCNSAPFPSEWLGWSGENRTVEAIWVSERANLSLSPDSIVNVAIKRRPRVSEKCRKTQRIGIPAARPLATIRSVLRLGLLARFSICLLYTSPSPRD